MKEVDFPAALETLKQGKLLIYPTETFYGLGARIKDSRALEKIFTLKNRDSKKPLSILVSKPEELSAWVSEFPPLAQILAKQFLPGPLTLVLPKSPGLDPRLTGGEDWVGIRCSSHPLARRLVEVLGEPITSTSANPSGFSSGQNKAQIQKYFWDDPDLSFLDGGDLPPSRGSTVVKISGDNLQLLREGDIALREIQACIGNL